MDGFAKIATMIRETVFGTSYPTSRTCTDFTQNTSALFMKHRHTSVGPIERCVVTLTSIKGRDRLLIRTLRSLLDQRSNCPYTIELNLSDHNYRDRDTGFPNRKLPSRLERFLKRHRSAITLHWVQNLGSYTKYHSCLQRYRGRNVGIVIVDDDRIYAPTLLQSLVDAHNTHGCFVGGRCFVLRHRTWWDLATLKYGNRLSTRKRTGYDCFMTGTGGILINPIMLSSDLLLRDDLFTRLAPYQDDIWINLVTAFEGVVHHSIHRYHPAGDNCAGRPIPHQIMRLYDINRKHNHRTNDQALERVGNFLVSRLKNCTHGCLTQHTCLTDPSVQKKCDAAIVVYAFSRSACLERCLQNLSRQAGLEKYDMYVFHDNCIYEPNRRIVTSPERVTAAVAAVSRVVPKARIIINTENLGIARQQHQAMEFVFAHMGYQRCLFVEDDVELAADSLVATLTAPIPKRCIGLSFTNKNKPLKPGSYRDLRRLTDQGQLGFHVWATSAPVYRSMQRLYRDAIQTLYRSVDYCNRQRDPSFRDRFKAWAKKNGYKHSYTSQDWVRVHCFNVAGRSELQIIGKYRYTGAEGLHMTSQRFKKMFGKSDDS